MPRRALLVEDDQSLQIAMRYLMENLGFDLVAAETREDAKRNIESGPYDIAIVDYYLRNVPSSDLIADMRRRFPRMPIICSTAARRENLQLDDAMLQPDAFLYKPFEASELRDLVNSLVA
ncbi:MAG TPA: response regulator [Rudaea sp.]|jgi:DNA-binding response OmpR family regulator|nr:response regulator [Rudaea sp.]